MIWWKKYRNNIITGVLLILATLSIAAHFRQDAQIRQQLRQSNHDLSTELERTSLELRRSQAARDHLRLHLDSILANSLALRKQLLTKDKEIASIRGRYNSIPVDSLGELMDNRARDASR